MFGSMIKEIKLGEVVYGISKEDEEFKFIIVGIIIWIIGVSGSLVMGELGFD